MPVRLRWIFLNIGLLVATTLCVAQNRKSNGSPRSEAEDKADFETVCGACHSPSMVSDILSAPEWKQTVENMVAIGAHGTDQQMEAVMRHLLRAQTKVNVNKATAAELPLVLDISEDTALAVVKYRDQHGNFRTLDDLKKVPGINAVKLDTRQDRVFF